MHPLVQLAKRAIEEYITNYKVIDPPVPEKRPPEMNQKAGVFVSLKEHGELRGCIGTWQPTRASVAEEVIANAIAAATQDPRFMPVRPAELPLLEISVDVLSPLEEVAGTDELDPRKFGVVVEHGGRRGLLLPDLPQVTSAEMQVRIAKQKAGLRPEDPAKVYRFTVQRYH